MMPIHIPQFFGNPFVPFQGLGGKVEPSEHTNPHQYLHSLLIRFRENGFDRIFSCNVHTAGI